MSLAAPRRPHLVGIPRAHLAHLAHTHTQPGTHPPEGRSPSAALLTPGGRLPASPLGTLRLPCGALAPSTPLSPLAPPLWLCLRTTVRRGCSAASPPGGRRGVPVTKRRNLRRQLAGAEQAHERAKACRHAHMQNRGTPYAFQRARRRAAAPHTSTAPHHRSPALLHGIKLREHLQQRSHRRRLQRVSVVHFDDLCQEGGAPRLARAYGQRDESGGGATQAVR